MAHDVFISYSSKDKSVADAACAVLEGRGVRCWVAPRDIAAGSDWGESIIDAIAGSRVMVLVFSANANASPQVKREVERAVNKGVTVVPFRIENVPLCKTLEYFVSTPHWMDAYTRPLEQHLGKLADTVLAIVRTEPVEGDDALSAVNPPQERQPQALPSVQPERRGLRRAGVPTAIAVGLLGALVVRAMISSTPPAVQAEPAARLATPRVVVANDVTPAPARPVVVAPSTTRPAEIAAPVAVPVADPAPAPKHESPATPPTQTPPEASAVDSAAEQRERALATAQAKRLRVRSVVLIGDERYCVINGRRYQEGESIDGFRVDRITPSRVIVAHGKFRFELRPQADVDSRVVSRLSFDNGTRDEDRSGSQRQPPPPPPPNGGPTVYGPRGPGSPPPPPPGPQPVPPGPRPLRR
jgi:hypothetical protein